MAVGEESGQLSAMLLRVANLVEADLQRRIERMVGLLTPPVGTVLNVAAGVGKVAMDEIIKRVMPYMWIEIILLLALTFFPELVTVPLYWLIPQ